MATTSTIDLWPWKPFQHCALPMANICSKFHSNSSTK